MMPPANDHDGGPACVHGADGTDATGRVQSEDARAGPSASRLAWVEPLAVFRAAQGREGLIWLDSGGDPGPATRWSVLALAPRETLEIRVGGGRIVSGTPDPFAAIEDLHERWRARLEGEGRRDGADVPPHAPTSEADERPAGIVSGVFREAPPFTGGLIALVGYDAGRALERLPSIAMDDPLLPDLWVGVYDAALVFDRVRRELWLTSWGLAASADQELRELAGLVTQSLAAAGETRAAGPGRGSGKPPAGDERSDGEGRSPAETPDAADLTATAADTGRARFVAGVAQIQEEIAHGEIYQANLTRRIVRAVDPADAPALYERLRSRSPTPFGAYVDAGSFRLLSASPERFLHVADGVVETWPIKGTRPRGRSPREDEEMRAELLASAKDAAELLMIVDLERNDLGRVCETGSVEVTDFPRAEAYSTVWHLVGTVRAKLRPGLSPVAALRAAFPGGSITGAPKLRAMEILERLEPSRRKFSMGALVAWDFGGRMDSSILIRTLTLRAGEAILDVGAGIVADSSPEAEYLETVAKAAPLLSALERS